MLRTSPSVLSEGGGGCVEEDVEEEIEVFFSDAPDAPGSAALIVGVDATRGEVNRRRSLRRGTRGNSEWSERKAQLPPVSGEARSRLGDVSNTLEAAYRAGLR